jgi:hypothetical protein
VNTSEPLLGSLGARQRVLEIQTKLHRWANDDPDRRFDDLFNLVTDPSFLLMAWERVEGNKGARSAGVDGRTAAFVRERIGVEDFLAELRDQLRSRSFRPLPVRERMIPKPGSRKRRRLGISDIALQHPLVALGCQKPCLGRESAERLVGRIPGRAVEEGGRRLVLRSAGQRRRVLSDTQGRPLRVASGARETCGARRRCYVPRASRSAWASWSRPRTMCSTRIGTNAWIGALVN